MLTNYKSRNRKSERQTKRGKRRKKKKKKIHHAICELKRYDKQFFNLSIYEQKKNPSALQKSEHAESKRERKRAEAREAEEEIEGDVRPSIKTDMR